MMTPDPVTLPLDFPPLLAMAEEAAHEFAAEAQFFNPDPAAFARLLADLTRSASRDAWVRWGVEQSIALAEQLCCDARPEFRKMGLAALTAAKRDGGQASLWFKWRDDPAALRAAVLAVAG